MEDNNGYGYVDPFDSEVNYPCYTFRPGPSRQQNTHTSNTLNLGVQDIDDYALETEVPQEYSLVSGHPSITYQSSPLHSQAEPSTSPREEWPCTFCQVTSPHKSQWKRHEWQHVPKTWVCMLHIDGTLNGRCIFCGNPDICSDKDTREKHLKTHRYQECITTEKVYQRKEHLSRHINNAHLDGDSLAKANILANLCQREPPRGSIEPKKLWCGFCRVLLDTWVERIEHVAGELDRGLEMTSWVPYPE